METKILWQLNILPIFSSSVYFADGKLQRGEQPNVAGTKKNTKKFESCRTTTRYIKAFCLNSSCGRGLRQRN
ncbi:hypothetical protein BT93_L0463 [Corymbia citriodora subsp. variegata]|uniref:Uncharacterized protein n=1 Tax=Corymbia citriodora subsp. variegata TaxID=360336 RepID=A0A8T0CPR1_CORYI|nr:hypothetical protein BT93_L0463 [Corymbia citriodora subsp. variegata]